MDDFIRIEWTEVISYLIFLQPIYNQSFIDFTIDGDEPKLSRVHSTDFIAL